MPEHDDPVAEAPWQRGYDRAMLRAITDLFTAYDAGLIQGAFTAVKDATVATWLACGELLVATDGGAPVVAIALSTATSTRTITDHTGNACARLLPGDLHLSRMACAKGYEGDLLAVLQDVTVTGRMVAAVWVEHPVDRAVMRALGMRRVGTKVRASSEMVGVFARWLATEAPHAEKVADSYALGRLGIPPIDTGYLLDQVDALDLNYADHYSSYNKGHAWSARALRGYGGDSNFIIKPAEMSKGWRREHPDTLSLTCIDTPLRAMLPAVEPILSLIPGAKQRIRLMRLQPGGGELTRHADIIDAEAGTADGQVMRIHVPLTTNPDVVFTMWRPDGSREQAHMAVGQAWSLDTRKPHTAVNGGDTPRLHLVMDVHASSALRGLLCDSGTVVATVPGIVLPPPRGAVPNVPIPVLPTAQGVLAL